MARVMVHYMDPEDNEKVSVVFRDVTARVENPGGSTDVLFVERGDDEVGRFDLDWILGWWTDEGER
jgi:hypothetical protein